MSASIGAQLTAAETGWKRILNTNTAFVYTNFSSGGDGNFSSGTDYYISALNSSNGYITQASLDANGHTNRAGEIKINFTGTKLRIISLLTNSAEESKIHNCSVYIDGVYCGQLYDEIKTNVWQYRTLTFEKTDIPDGNHLLQIVVEPSSYRFWFDSIDIADDATVFKPDTSIEFDDYIESDGIVDAFDKVEEGDILTCNYTFSSPLYLGNFSNFKLSKTPQQYSVVTPKGTSYKVSDIFEIAINPQHPECYELNQKGLKFKPSAVFDYTESGGMKTSRLINLQDEFKEVIDLDEHNMTALVIPKDVVIKTKQLVPLRADGTFSGIDMQFSTDDMYAKYLVSVNNSVFYYFNTNTRTWVPADISDVYTKGIEDFSSITKDEFKPLFNGVDKIGLIILIGIKDPDDIEHYDYIQDRIASIIELNQGNVDFTTSSKTVTMNLYYTYADGNKKNNEKHFISANVVQQGMPWSVIKDTVASDAKLDLTYSKYYPQIYLTIPTAGTNDTDYEKYVLSDNDKYNYVDNYSWVKTSETNYYRAKEDVFNEIEYLTSDTVNDSKIGFRPEIIVNMTQKVTHRYNTECILPIVKKMADLKPGTAIACSYVAPDSGKPGTFIIGKNGKKILPDYGGATPNGYFYWICVGYAPSGALRLVADRNIQTFISWEALNTAGYCVTSGVTTKLGSVKKCIVRLMSTVSNEKATRDNHTEWDDYISYLSENGILASANNIWNAATLKSWTLTTPQGAMANRIIRGAQDEDTVADEYVQENKVSTLIDEYIGFRPLADVPTWSEDTTTYPECELEIAKNVGTCRPGQAVVCEYRADTADTVGQFTFNHDSTKDPIGDVAPSTPNGKFYFICVGYAPSGAKRFIADRNVQTSISWETLNSAGYCVTSGRDCSAETGIQGSLMRLIHSDVTNYDMPLDSSEWDEYLMQEKIGDTDISAEKCNNWNMLKSHSWMLDTPHATNFSGNQWTMGDRVIRGNEKIDYSLSPSTFTASTNTLESVGFRPLMDVSMRYQSVINETKINTTHINEYNLSNKNIHITGSFTFMDESLTYENASIKFYVNDVDTEIEYKLDATLSYEIDVPIEKFETGSNVFKIIITTIDRDNQKVDNKFTFPIEKEDKTALVKTRDFAVYTDGFNLGDGMSINGTKVVNNKKVAKYNIPEKLDIPANTIKITFTEG